MSPNHLTQSRTVHVGDRSVPLSPLQHALWATLLAGDGGICTTAELTRAIPAPATDVPGMVAELHALLPEVVIQAVPRLGWAMPRVGVLG